MHIAVIGAGPAGSVAALLLARGGAAVTLIERHRFPRHKVCGECLSALGRDVLKRHGLEAAIAAVGVELVRTRLQAAGASAAIDLPRPMLGISRAVLDQMLLDAAAAEGVEVIQPGRVTAVEPVAASAGSSGATLRFTRDNSSAVETLIADFVVLGNGAATFAGAKPSPTTDLGIKTHFRDVRADAAAITLYAADGCYGGAAPIEGGRWNAAFSVPAQRVRAACGDVAAVFASLIESDRAMRDAFGRAQRIEPWLAAPLPRFAPRQDWPANVVPVGNAAAAIEPIGGEGMGLAIRSAELAAEAILAGRLDSLRSEYKRLWRSRGMGCRMAALAMTNRSIASAALGLADSPALSAIALAMIGKTSDPSSWGEVG